MTIKDGEKDYINETADELRSRMVMYNMFANVLLNGYKAYRSYGVDFMALPEWKEDAPLDLAAKMKPQKAQEIVVAWLEKLDDAVAAGIRRKQFIAHNGGKTPPTKN